MSIKVELKIIFFFKNKYCINKPESLFAPSSRSAITSKRLASREII